MVIPIVETMARAANRTSKTKKRVSRRKKNIELGPTMTSKAEEPTVEMSLPETPGMARSQSRKTLYILCTLLVVIVLGYLLFQRGFIVGAIVNGRPIYSWQIYSVLASRFGKQTLEGMVSEELIRQEAKKSGIAISKAEINAREAEIVKGLGGGANIDELLKFQGISKSDFDQQIGLQLTVQRIVGKGVTVDDKEVDAYLEKNKATSTATDPGALREEAKKTLTDQKVGDKIQPWFTSLKDKAKILRFFQ